MGNVQSVRKIGFEDMQYIQKHKINSIIINTLDKSDQNCIIWGTTPPIGEEKCINDALEKDLTIKIIIYGRNCIDDNIYDRYKTLYALGFKNVYVYPGGLFEWLCLQDIYGAEDFKTNTKELDILKYKPNGVLNIGLLTN
tara:strand:- start:12379 stop:12798 length:420 start_codon:yes stop_codon:yes gene_type:complete